jgi:hypothetical protein
MQVAALSTQYIYSDVQALETQDVGDPSENAVQFTFLSDLAASPTDDATWYDGAWEEDGGPAVWTAKCLIGPGSGGFIGTLGNTYQVWLQISDSPEAPIIKAGPISFI